jgi:FkbM family methyltransferase
MKFLDRNLAVYFRRIPDIPIYAVYFLRCLWLFKNPFQFLRAYITRQSMPGGVIHLRSGTSIHLTDHPHDPITVFVIFIRQDYGKIPKGATVVDIGANNGVFALYAIEQGAKEIYAFEPNSAAYSCLQKNISINQLQNKVSASQLAVTSNAGQKVKFPKAASVYNAILTEDSNDAFEIVNTTSLPVICQPIDEITVIKIDCEGAEYDILFNSTEKEFHKIHEIKLEYHKGQLGELQAHLKCFGFSVSLLKPDSPTYGNMWLTRAAN